MIDRELFVWEKNHIEVCEKLNLFEGKDVLEVGGAIPESITKKLGVKSWTCIDKWVGLNVHNTNYQIKDADITTVELPEKSFDLIISTNAFEHINNLDAGLKRMKSFLRPRGYISALFGPIWSSSKGHHLWAYDENGKLYTFNDDAISPWGHLIYSKDEMRNFLVSKFSSKIVDNILDNIYGNGVLNHLFYEDYFEMINNLGLEVLEFRDWHSSTIPDEKDEKLLKEKFGDKNFSTVSVKFLLKKTNE